MGKKVNVESPLNHGEMLYNFVIRLYTFGIWIASFFSEKAKFWINGRKNILSKLQNQIPTDTKLVWIHCASLGEFEQGRPLIESLKKETDFKILLTFFSPSGYEIRKDYAQADYISYLPADTPQNAHQFLEIIQPEIAIFVKYEFWYNYLERLQEKQIPTILIAGLFRNSQPFFQWYGKRFLKILKGFQYLFVQDIASLELLQNHDIQQVSVVGDTRIDRVLQIAVQAKSFPIIQDFTKGKPTLIGGSTWQQDEDILIQYINENPSTEWKYIFAPHQIDEAHIKQISLKLTVPNIRYSQIKDKIPTDIKVLIIDNIGMLSSLYKYGKVAYIGGGFGSGIHNTLEPIAFELPVIFGPKYQKFTEAVQLVEQGGGFSINNYEDFNNVFKQLEAEEFYNATAHKAKDYLIKNKGATKEILEWLDKHFAKIVE